MTIPDAPDRADTRQSVIAHEQAGICGFIEVVKEFVDKKPHTMLRLTDAGRDAFQAYREKMIQVLH